jgi:hypothetical protein
MRKFQANGRNWLAAVLVVIATLLSVGCGGTPRGKAGASVASLVFNTESLDFGALSVGSSRKSSLTVSNSSPDGGTATVTNIVVTGAGFSLVSPTDQFSLAPGKTATITVSFAPKVAGNAVGQLSIFLAGTPDSGNISLTGSTVTGDQLVASPSRLNFGGVALGSSKTLTGTLTVGDSDVTVSSASWNGEGFSVSDIDFPVTIPANTSISYRVTFAPQAVGSASGGIIFVSNASNSPFTQTLTATGAAVAQATQHSVDLTWNLAASADGYNIYRATVSGGPYTRLNAGLRQGTNFTDSSVKSGATYYYVATAVDAGVESGYSNEVVATIPTP